MATNLLQKVKLTIYNKVMSLKSYIEAKSLPKDVICSVRGNNIILRVDSKRELKRSKSFSTKEPNTLDWLVDMVKEGDVLYDIGANIGQYSLYPAIRLVGKCQIYAFEPEALNFAKLNTNINLNNLSKCIKAYPLAFSSKNKLSEFYIKEMEYGEARNRLGDNLDNLGQRFVPEHVQGAVSLTLDSIVYDYGLEPPNHIKIDVDGLEREIVENGRCVFEDKKIKSILVETTAGRDREWFIDFFTKLGFKLSSYPDHRKRTENLVFIKK